MPTTGKIIGLDPLPFERETLGYTPKEAHQQAAVDDKGLCENLSHNPLFFQSLTYWRASPLHTV